MWLAAFSRGCKTCSLKPKHHLLSEFLSGEFGKLEGRTERKQNARTGDLFSLPLM